MLHRFMTASASAPAASAARSAGKRARGGLHGLIGNYKQLSKFKLSTLVVATAAGGFVAGSGESVDWAGLGWTALGTYGAAACANTLNQLYEVANDARMSRTMNRPLPAGRMTRMHAALFALITGTAGVAILYDKASAMNPVRDWAMRGLHTASHQYPHMPSASWQHAYHSTRACSVMWMGCCIACSVRVNRPTLHLRSKEMRITSRLGASNVRAYASKPMHLRRAQLSPPPHHSDRLLP